jgi:uncharacterized protein (TIGR03083 family)
MQDDAVATRPGLAAELCGYLSEASSAFAAMLRGVRDPEVPAIGEWNAGEAAAHASNSSRHFLATLRGDAIEREEYDRIAESNARALADDPERDPRRLADRLEHGERELVAFVHDTDGDPLVEPFAGIQVPVSTVLAIELGELLVHGYDVGRAADLPWRIDPRQAAVMLEGLWPLLPFVVDPRRAAGSSASWDLRIRHGTRRLLVLDRGVLRVDVPSGAVADCHMSAEPVAFVLLTYGRVGAWRPIVAGKLLAWGRRPWRAFMLQAILKKA